MFNNLHIPASRETRKVFSLITTILVFTAGNFIKFPFDLDCFFSRPACPEIILSFHVFVPVSMGEQFQSFFIFFSFAV